MTVTEIGQSDFTKVWEKENLGLFLSPHIANLLGRKMLFLKLETTNGTVVYFSCYTYKSWGFHFIINPPGMAYCGFGLVNPPENEPALKRLKSDALKAFADHLLKAYPNATVDLRIALSGIDFTLTSGIEINRISHTVLDISVSEADLFSQLSSRRKRNIKKQSKGYQVIINPPIDKVMALLEHTFVKSQHEHIRPFYKAGLAGETPFLKANLVSFEGQFLATNVVAYDKELAYYFVGGIDPVVNDHNAGTIAMWDAILTAKKAGMKTFNFCGSSIPSISEYFKSFGGFELEVIRLSKGNQLVEKLKKLKGKS
jgi:hypothetical protein